MAAATDWLNASEIFPWRLCSQCLAEFAAVVRVWIKRNIGLSTHTHEHRHDEDECSANKIMPDSLHRTDRPGQMHKFHTNRSKRTTKFGDRRGFRQKRQQHRQANATNKSCKSRGCGRLIRKMRLRFGQDGGSSDFVGFLRGAHTQPQRCICTYGAHACIWGTYSHFIALLPVALAALNQIAYTNISLILDK